jgi:putative membrane protein
MKEHLIVYLKGISVGVANIIPGVSGGTLALITGVFERTVDSIKSFDAQAVKFLFKGDIKKFTEHTDLTFILSLLAGAGSGVFALSFVLGSLFENYPKYIWAFFFGLILASVFFVAKRIGKWNSGVIASLLVGTAIAVLITNIFEPAAENSSVLYLFLCGIVATCSMILPGLSGSFILILMGNYELVMIRSVKNLDFGVLLPLFAGAGLGIIAFSHVLSWVFKKFKDQTIALLSGFIIGSLSLLWPWKTAITKTFETGKVKVIGYNWHFPSSFSFEDIFSILLIFIGIAAIWALEKYAVEEIKS